MGIRFKRARLILLCTYRRWIGLPKAAEDETLVSPLWLPEGLAPTMCILPLSLLRLARPLFCPFECLQDAKVAFRAIR